MHQNKHSICRLRLSKGEDVDLATTRCVVAFVRTGVCDIYVANTAREAVVPYGFEKGECGALLCGALTVRRRWGILAR